MTCAQSLKGGHAAASLPLSLSACLAILIKVGEYGKTLDQIIEGQKHRNTEGASCQVNKNNQSPQANGRAPADALVKSVNTGTFEKFMLGTVQEGKEISACGEAEMEASLTDCNASAAEQTPGVKSDPPGTEGKGHQAVSAGFEGGDADAIQGIVDKYMSYDRALLKKIRDIWAALLAGRVGRRLSRYTRNAMDRAIASIEIDLGEIEDDYRMMLEKGGYW
ncbi:hypothetical protein BJY04DRAFT_222722 [Aspergillus karnatakaensis]|uniref:uncharacterized protein n=1 Tax=Aspergillus karnatakaensis TaxID=1810916 RepID=UPI003CCD8EF4